MEKISNTFLWAVILLLIIVTVELGCVLFLNRGVFTYTLDDPYIHLALAENLTRFHYGINMEEFSAPASSILWPFLLVPFTLLSFAHLAPLFLNIIIAAALLFIISQILIVSFEKAEKKIGNYLHAILLIAFIPASNLVGLIFTGMEHTLQVFFVAAIFYSVILQMKTQRIYWWGIASLVIAPLVRYENLAVSIPMCLFLYSIGYRKQMVLALLLTVILIGGFSFSLISAGLSWLPQSVIIKGGDLAGINPLDRILKAPSDDRMLLLAGIAMILGFLSTSLAFPKIERKFILFGAGAIGLHLIYGQSGWYCRYEIYMWAFALLILVYILREKIIDTAKKHQVFYSFLTGFFVLFFCFPYFTIYTTLPVAANNIFDEQYYMHKFVTEYYKKPVAVNDIGYVSFRNDVFVLDLIGLSSRDAFEAHSNASYGNVAWMDSLARGHNAQLAIIYETWFPGVPSNWKKIAELRLSRKKTTAGGRVVSFFTLTDSIRPEIKGQLVAFKQTMHVENMVLFDN